MKEIVRKLRISLATILLLAGFILCVIGVIRFIINPKIVPILFIVGVVVCVVGIVILSTTSVLKNKFRVAKYRAPKEVEIVEEEPEIKEVQEESTETKCVYCGTEYENELKECPSCGARKTK